MSTYTLIIQPEAELDLDEAFEYYEFQKAGLGFDLLEEVAILCERIEGNPLLFQKIENDRRRAVVKRFKYNIIYKIKNDKIFVLAIMHGSRDPKRWKDRK